MKTKVLVFLTCLLSFSSCGVLNQHIAKYGVYLSSVESPENAREQFGETKIKPLSEDGIERYLYEDDYIKIIWSIGETELYFSLTNKAKHTIVLDWDEMSYVNINGDISRVIHKGIKYNETEKSQAPISIPRGATVNDFIIPVSNIFYQQYIGWRHKYLIPSVYSKKVYFNDPKTGARSYIGKTISLLMPIKIENVKNDYTFIFKVRELLNPME